MLELLATGESVISHDQIFGMELTEVVAWLSVISMSLLLLKQGAEAKARNAARHARVEQRLDEIQKTLTPDGKPPLAESFAVVAHEHEEVKTNIRILQSGIRRVKEAISNTNRRVDRLEFMAGVNDKPLPKEE